MSFQTGIQADAIGILTWSCSRRHIDSPGRPPTQHRRLIDTPATQHVVNKDGGKGKALPGTPTEPDPVETPWYHLPSGPKPEQYYLGLTGTMKELDAAISTEPVTNKRCVELKLQGREGRLWIVKAKKGRYTAFFADHASHATAKARLEASSTPASKTPKKSGKKTSIKRK